MVTGDIKRCNHTLDGLMERRMEEAERTKEVMKDEEWKERSREDEESNRSIEEDFFM